MAESRHADRRRKKHVETCWGVMSCFTDFSDSQIRNARRLIEAGEPVTHVARDLRMSRATLYRRMAELDAREWVGNAKI